MSNSVTDPGRVIGVGGIFFKGTDAEALRGWYQSNLGIVSGEYGAEFLWRMPERPDEEHRTVWSIFPGNTSYFNPGKATFMLNYIVDDMDALLAKVDRTGPNAEIKREDHEYGRFAWLIDPDGNKIELWEPPKAAPR